jgi:hypothetical protein
MEMLKGFFSRNIEKGERVSAKRKSRREEFGSAGSGSICYAIKRILIGMSILFIEIRLNTVESIRFVIGRIPAFTAI